ncbi:hypothetical protein I3760_07G214900 [Carya illinoinensis]|nr:hypothetical protein I3760_07G214900 [Carya illinoinensis]KAG2700041.1 hypothetical protein I3760_07G214900 [Carya illinoinensis]
MSTKLTKEGEFLIMGCDGIWDVFVSQNALDFAQDMVDEAMKRKSGDNLAVVVVCFQHQPPSNLIAPRSRVHRSFSAKGLRFRCFGELQVILDALHGLQSHLV